MQLAQNAKIPNVLATLLPVWKGGDMTPGSELSEWILTQWKKSQIDVWIVSSSIQNPGMIDSKGLT